MTHSLPRESTFVSSSTPSRGKTSNNDLSHDRSAPTKALPSGISRLLLRESPYSLQGTRNRRKGEKWLILSAQQQTNNVRSLALSVIILSHHYFPCEVAYLLGKTKGRQIRKNSPLSMDKVGRGPRYTCVAEQNRVTRLFRVAPNDGVKASRTLGRLRCDQTSFCQISPSTTSSNERQSTR